MKIVKEINNCNECEFQTNSSKEHDCAFTSAPHPIRWWCKKNTSVEVSSETIPKNCPLKCDECI